MGDSGQDQILKPSEVDEEKRKERGKVKPKPSSGKIGTKQVILMFLSFLFKDNSLTDFCKS